MGDFLKNANNTEYSSTALWKECVELINGPNGEAASILLAYTCFSVLKPFFPQYHALNKDTTYIDGKKYIPKQIALNIQCDNGEYTKEFVDICCGYFSRCKAPIIAGISIKQTSKNGTKLNIDKYEKDLLQPACALWVNYKPDKELTRSGRILDLHLYLQNENDYRVSHSISETLVNILTYGIYNWTVEMANGLKSKGYWMKLKESHRRRGDVSYSLEPEYKRRLSLLSHHSRSLRSKYISVAQDVSSVPESAEEESKIGPDVDKVIVEKIAYLSASFQVFAEMVAQSGRESDELCVRVERNIVTAFKNSLDSSLQRKFWRNTF